MTRKGLADFPTAVLAGGLATRLGPLTEKTPKSLLPVNGEPFLAHQLRLLEKQGIERVVLCVGHLGEMIEARFGRGENFGLILEYSSDGPQLLGTGGALRKALPLLGEHFFVLYGDSYLPIDFASVASAFSESRKSGLMTVFRNENRWDSSNVRFENGRILEYSKNRRDPEMRYIDYGLSVLSPRAFTGMPNAFDLSQLMAALIEKGDLAGHEVDRRFYEIGSPAGLIELEEFFNQQKTQAS